MNEFSIIVPIYNSEKYLSKCIKSILNQTYKDFELILINDGSIDTSGTICDYFKNIDNRIKVVHKKNGGVSSARNRGLDICSGNNIIFIDSDDHIDKNLLNELNIALNKYKIDTIIHTIDIQKNNLLYKTNQEYDKYILISDGVSNVMPDFIKNRYINQPWNKLYNKRIIDENNIRFNENISLGEDALFNYYYFNNISKFLIINDNFYNYQDDNDSSLTNTYNRRKIDMLMYVNDRLQELVQNSMTYSKSKRAANYIRIKGIYSSLFDIIDNDEVSKEEKDLLFKKIFSSNKKFDLKEIDEMSFKILAAAVNTRNRKILEMISKIVYRIK